MNKLFDRIKFVYFILVIFTLLSCQLMRYYGVITNYITSIVISILGLLGLILYITDKILCKRKIDKYDIIIYLLIFLGIISCIFSINFKISIFGFYGRNEGLLVIITYYILFLNSKNMSNGKYRNVILNVMLLYALFHSLYAICQYIKPLENLSLFGIMKSGRYSTGFESNSNFYSSIAIIGLYISLCKSLFEKKKIGCIYIIISAVIFLGMLCSGTMSSSLTLFIMIPLIIMLLFVKRVDVISTFIRIIIICILFGLAYNIFNIYNRGYLVYQIDNMGNEIKNVSQGKIEESYGTGRIRIWKETLKIVPKNIINGIGIDNFYYGFGNKRLIDEKSKFAVDKAHNEYLQKLITEGIFSFIVYVILLLMVLMFGIKKIIKEKEINVVLISLVFSFMAYSIQAFFNISVICVAPIYYIIIGLIVGEVYETN